MTALPPEETRSMLAGEHPALPAQSAIAARWAYLHEQAQELAQLADLAPEPPSAATEGFAQRLDQAQSWQCNLAWQSLEDIDAMMQPGLTALRIIAAREHDTTAPALALWREFHEAREAVLAMLARTPKGEALDPT